MLIGLGMGLANAAVFKMVPKYVPHAVGGASGLVGGLGALGGFVIPPFLGAVRRRTGRRRLFRRVLRLRRAGGGCGRRFRVLLASRSQLQVDPLTVKPAVRSGTIEVSAMSHFLDRLTFFSKSVEHVLRRPRRSRPMRTARWEDGYRKRWQHDKIVRSTHGVNCTGSCSWKIYVKGGIVTWETQQTDYPRTRPDLPNHEPRGCARGASY